MKRAACYVRVSTEDQKLHGLSVDSQIVALKEYCEKNNYYIVDIYNDAGISARKSYKKRPAMLKMIKDCQEGKIDIILMTKLDRFFRSVKDYYEVMSQIGEIPWRTIWEDYETETSSGVFKVNIMLSVAQSEADRTSERIKAINDYKRARGDVVCGSMPIGYKRENKRLVKDEKTREIVETFFHAYLCTFNVTDTIKAVNAIGAPMSHQKARRILRSPVYRGDAYGTECEPYITSEEAALIEQSVNSRRTPKYNNVRTYLFSGIAVCPGCGHNLAGSVSKKKYKDGSIHDFKIYKCQRHFTRYGCDFGKVMYENTIEKFLIKEIENMIGNKKVTAEAASKNDVSKKITALKQRLSRVGDRYEDGDISRDEYREKRDSLNFEIQKLESMTSNQSTAELPDNWQDIYAELDESKKHAFWCRIIKKIIVHGTNDYEVILN